MDWVAILKPVSKRGVTLYVYANNHYVDFAPETVRLFNEMWVEGKLDALGIGMARASTALGPRFGLDALARPGKVGQERISPVARSALPSNYPQRNL